MSSGEGERKRNHSINSFAVLQAFGFSDTKVSSLALFGAFSARLAFLGPLPDSSGASAAFSELTLMSLLNCLFEQGSGPIPVQRLFAGGI